MLFVAFKLILFTANADYGTVYEAKEVREIPRLSLELAYSRDISNSVLNLDGLSLRAQWKIWRYLSTGVYGQIMLSSYSTTGQALADLESADIRFATSIPRWTLFSETLLDLFIGEYNVFNWTTLRVDLLFGGGLGNLNERNAQSSKIENKVSYLWSVHQRMRLYSEDEQEMGLTVGLAGHRGGLYFHPGFYWGFK